MKLIDTAPPPETKLRRAAHHGRLSRAHSIEGCPAYRPCDVRHVLGGSVLVGFVTVRQAAQLASVHEETVRRAYRANLLAAQRVGTRGIRIHPSDLRAWMAAGMPTRPRSALVSQAA